jgi:hypothetical protein
MTEEAWGVIFEEDGVTYLVAIFETRQEASDEAERRDEAAHDEAMERHADDPDVHPEPKREDYEGMHEHTVVDRQTAEDAREQLERGLAVRLP